MSIFLAKVLHYTHLLKKVISILSSVPLVCFWKVSLSRSLNQDFPILKIHIWHGLAALWCNSHLIYWRYNFCSVHLWPCHLIFLPVNILLTISNIIDVHVSVILEVLFTFPLQAHEDGGYIKLLVKKEVKERVSGPVQRVLNSFHSEVRTFVQYFIISKIYLNATNTLLMSQRRAL